MAAFTTATARDAVKTRCGLLTTDFDALVDSIVLQAVSRLQPDFLLSGTSIITFTGTPDSHGELNVALNTLPGTPASVSYVEFYSSYNQIWTDVPSVRILGGALLRLRGLPPNVTSFRCLPASFYALSSVPDVLQPPVIWMSQAEFYSSIIGDKRKFNQYMQSRSTSLEEMQDLMDMYEKKAQDYLDARRPAYVA